MLRFLLGQNGSLLRISDEELCRRSAASDAAAFRELFNRYWERVFRLTLAIVRSEAEAEDVAQSVFVELHCRAKEFDPAKGTFCNWLLRYAYTRAIDQKRYLVSRKYYDHCDVDEWVFAGVAEDGLLFGLTADERLRLVEQLLTQLNQRQRFVVEAYFLRGQTVEEIATLMNESYGNTRHLLYRGLEKLREALQPALVMKQAKDEQPTVNTTEVALARARAL